jgi:alpha-L-fucosidase
MAYMGNWIKTYGESIYGTKGGYMRPQTWGCITQKSDTMFVHVLDNNATSIKLENFPFKKIAKAYLLKNNAVVQTQLSGGTLTITVSPAAANEPDEVIVLVNKK